MPQQYSGDGLFGQVRVGELQRERELDGLIGRLLQQIQLLR